MFLRAGEAPPASSSAALPPQAPEGSSAKPMFSPEDFVQPSLASPSSEADREEEGMIQDTSDKGVRFVEHEDDIMERDERKRTQGFFQAEVRYGKNLAKSTEKDDLQDDDAMELVEESPPAVDGDDGAPADDVMDDEDDVDAEAAMQAQIAAAREQRQRQRLGIPPSALDPVPNLLDHEADPLAMTGSFPSARKIPPGAAIPPTTKSHTKRFGGPTGGASRPPPPAGAAPPTVAAPPPSKKSTTQLHQSSLTKIGSAREGLSRLRVHLEQEKEHTSFLKNQSAEQQAEAQSTRAELLGLEARLGGVVRYQTVLETFQDFVVELADYLNKHVAVVEEAERTVVEMCCGYVANARKHISTAHLAHVANARVGSGTPAQEQKEDEEDSMLGRGGTETTSLGGAGGAGLQQRPDKKLAALQHNFRADLGQFRRACASQLNTKAELSAAEIFAQFQLIREADSAKYRRAFFHLSLEEAVRTAIRAELLGWDPLNLGGGVAPNRASISKFCDWFAAFLVFSERDEGAEGEVLFAIGRGILLERVRRCVLDCFDVVVLGTLEGSYDGAPPGRGVGSMPVGCDRLCSVVREDLPLLFEAAPSDEQRASLWAELETLFHGDFMSGMREQSRQAKRLSLDLSATAASSASFPHHPVSDCLLSMVLVIDAFYDAFKISEDSYSVVDKAYKMWKELVLEVAAPGAAGAGPELSGTERVWVTVNLVSGIREWVGCAFVRNDLVREIAVAAVELLGQVRGSSTGEELELEGWCAKLEGLLG